MFDRFFFASKRPDQNEPVLECLSVDNCTRFDQAHSQVPECPDLRFKSVYFFHIVQCFTITNSQMTVQNRHKILVMIKNQKMSKID